MGNWALSLPVERWSIARIPERLQNITEGLTLLDPVDLSGYTPGMPEDYPPPEGYRCQFEDGRRQNDHLKLWFGCKNVEARFTAAERHSIAEAVLEDVAKKENKADARLPKEMAL